MTHNCYKIFDAGCERRAGVAEASPSNSMQLSQGGLSRKLGGLILLSIYRKMGASLDKLL